MEQHYSAPRVSHPPSRQPKHVLMVTAESERVSGNMSAFGVQSSKVGDAHYHGILLARTSHSTSSDSRDAEMDTTLLVRAFAKSHDKEHGHRE